MNRYAHLIVALLIACTCTVPSRAATVTFFDASQTATLITEGTTWDKVQSNGYYFTYTRDKLFTGGGPVPIGRNVRVPWPQGVEAQAVTTAPSKAKITIERVDGDVFDITAFTARLLANTAGAGGSFEVVPFLDGEEVLQDPVVFDATGYYWSTFSYDTSPNPWGSTAPLTGYDKYTFDLYVDFALIGLTLEGAPVPGPPGDFDQNGVVDGRDFLAWQRGESPVAFSAADLADWQTNYGASAAVAMSVAVPEPMSQVLAVAGAFVIGLSRRRVVGSSQVC
jgi:hypothetical protein